MLPESEKALLARIHRIPIVATLQMHGGYGYIDEYKVQRLYRDAKILEIYEGTKEIEKTIVARSVLR